MEKRKGEEKEGGTAKKKEEGKQWARRKEERREQRGGRKGGREGGREKGRECKVKKKKQMTNKLNKATVSLSVLIRLETKSMSTHHTQQIFSFDPLMNLLMYTTLCSHYKVLPS